MKLINSDTCGSNTFQSVSKNGACLPSTDMEVTPPSAHHDRVAAASFVAMNWKWAMEANLLKLP